MKDHIDITSMPLGLHHFRNV